MLDYSKQAYYKRLKQMEEKAVNECLIIELVKKKRKVWKKGSGTNLLAALKKDFQEHSIKMGRDKFFDLLRENGLLKKIQETNGEVTMGELSNYVKEQVDLESLMINNKEQTPFVGVSPDIDKGWKE